MRSPPQRSPALDHAHTMLSSILSPPQSPELLDASAAPTTTASLSSIPAGDVHADHAKLEAVFDEYEAFFAENGATLAARGDALVLKLLALTGALSARCAGFARSLMNSTDRAGDAAMERLTRQLAESRADVEAERDSAAEGLLRVERRRVADAAESQKAASAQRTRLVARLTTESARKIAALERQLMLERERHKAQLLELTEAAHSTLAMQSDTHHAELVAEAHHAFTAGRDRAAESKANAKDAAEVKAKAAAKEAAAAQIAQQHAARDRAAEAKQAAEAKLALQRRVNAETMQRRKALLGQMKNASAAPPPASAPSPSPPLPPQRAEHELEPDSDDEYEAPLRRW